MGEIMGKRNRQRRREKVQRRQRQATRRSQPRREPPPLSSGPADVDGWLCEAAMAFREREEAVLSLTVGLLADGWRIAPATVAAVVEGRLCRAVAAAWEIGWQPADLPRLVTRKLGAEYVGLVRMVIIDEAVGYRDRADADPAWIAQLDGIGVGRHGGLLAALLDEKGIVDGLHVAAGLLSFLWHLPRIPLLADPPARWGRASHRRRAVPDGVDAKLLERVRTLLAKAESTTFPEEAEALTAKAHQLMSRHAIDRAIVDASPSVGPVGRRVATDDPYAGVKSLLLSEVAGASRCRSVWSRDLGFATVFGFPNDLDTVELLYTSLLVQATQAMVRVGNGVPGSRSRSRSFRQSFLTAFAHRISQRLREGRDAAESEAAEAHGDALLPVLASRLDAVDRARDEAYPDLESRSFSATDVAGWAAGTAAAQLASLAVGPELVGEAAG
ncbi:MAG: DUF2786 domain-containing protein [Egibacteraceae bacterium]